jgi:hypothetical protein
MKMLFCIVGTLTASFVTEASAQVVDLTGRYRCIQACSVGSIGKSGYVTRNAMFGARLVLHRGLGSIGFRRIACGSRTGMRAQSFQPTA